LFLNNIVKILSGKYTAFVNKNYTDQFLKFNIDIKYIILFTSKTNIVSIIKITNFINIIVSYNNILYNYN